MDFNTQTSIWNTKAIREFLSSAFNREDLLELCYDYFRDVYHESEDATKRQIIQRLIQFCEHRVKIDQLLKYSKNIRPT